MQLQASVIIERPIADVFAFAATVDNLPSWMSGVSQARLGTAEMGHGAHFVVDYTSAMRTVPVEFEVVAWEPPSLLGLEIARGPFTFQGRIRFAAHDAGTMVTSEIEADPDSLSTRLVSILLGPFLRDRLVDRLRGELEAMRDAIAGSPSLA